MHNALGQPQEEYIAVALLSTSYKKNQGTLALLLNTPLGPWRIYLGKLLGALGVLCLLAAFGLRLNVVGLQLMNSISTPLQMPCSTNRALVPMAATSDLRTMRGSRFKTLPQLRL